MTLEADNRCTNCGQPALRSDNICWHCGEPLPWYDEDAAAEIRVKEGWSTGASTSTILLYAGITIVVIAALLLVTNSLADRPQLQIAFGTRAPDDWVQVIDSDETISMYLPDGWAWFDSSDGVQREQMLALLNEHTAYGRGADPLGAAVDDLELVFFAHRAGTSSERIPPFLTVVTSGKLNRLEYQDAAQFLDQGDFSISELRFVEDFDKSHLKVIVEPDIGTEGEDIRCRQQFIRGEITGMIFSLCAPATLYSAQQSDFEEIANSFQRLS